METEILSSAKQWSFMACNRIGRRKNLISNLCDAELCWIHVSLVLWYPAIPLSLPFDTLHAALAVTTLATKDMERLWLSWVVFCWKETEYLNQAFSGTLGCISAGRAVSWSCHGVGCCPGCRQIRESAELSKGLWGCSQGVCLTPPMTVKELLQEPKDMIQSFLPL